MQEKRYNFFYLRFSVVKSAMSASSKPIPIALPNELIAAIDQVAEKLNLTRSELMRLSMRIGLAEIGTVAEPITKTVARDTERLGITFADWVRSTQQQWSKEKSEQNEAGQKNANLLESDQCAPPAPSRKRSPSTGPTPTTANIVRLPPPPVIATLLHDMVAETSNPSPVTEPRSEARYEKKRRKA